MRSGLLLIFLVCAVAGAWAQYTPSVLSVDSLKIDFRTSGSIDSVDLQGRRAVLNTPGMMFGGNNGIPDLSIYQNHFNESFSSDLVQNVRYSGLPHIGFGYSFGAQGSQIVDFGYEQVFGKKVIVNLDAKTFRSNGYLRNSSVDDRYGKLLVLVPGSIWSSEIKTSINSSKVDLAAGLRAGSDPATFPLIFLPVNKSDANSHTRRSEIQMSNYVDFLSKDSSKALGLMIENRLTIRDRLFLESDTLFGIYNFINIDSTSTRDNYQLSRIDNGAGFFTRNKNLYAAGLIQYNYWKYYNLSFDHDTVEIAVVGRVKYLKKSFYGEGELNYALRGAGNSFSGRVNLGVKKDLWEAQSQLNFQSGWPDPFVRSYYANNIEQEWNYGSGTSTFNLKNRVSLKIKLPVVLQHELLSIKDGYWLMNDQLVNDQMTNVLVNRFSLSTNFKYKGLSVQPLYTYTASQQAIRPIPAHTIKGRVLVKGKVLKAKKMLAFLGADLFYSSSFDLLSFSPVWSSFKWDSSTGINDGFADLSAFGGFEIEKFRFFVRFEHLGAMWNDPFMELQEGYTFPENSFRLGITWDFFN
jgi:hypothetical protein